MILLLWLARSGEDGLWEDGLGDCFARGSWGANSTDFEVLTAWVEWTCHVNQGDHPTNSCSLFSYIDAILHLKNTHHRKSTLTIQDGMYLDTPEVDKMTSFQSPATLICVPSHLHLQWQNEIKKFVGNRYKAGDELDCFLTLTWWSKMRCFIDWFCVIPKASKYLNPNFWQGTLRVRCFLDFLPSAAICREVVLHHKATNNTILCTLVARHVSPSPKKHRSQYLMVIVCYSLSNFHQWQSKLDNCLFLCKLVPQKRDSLGRMWSEMNAGLLRSACIYFSKSGTQQSLFKKQIQTKSLSKTHWLGRITD